MPDFSIKCDLTQFTALDELALAACQTRNFGNAGDWFGCFRGGIYGMKSRLLGVETHYFQIHEWAPRIRMPADTEYHLASLFFHMDSAVECLIFALNALGWCVRPSDFRDVDDERSLRRISPMDVLGDTSRAPRAGYGQIFPGFQAAIQADAVLLARIRDLHDVSKHRQTIFASGMLRDDQPPGFFESLGLAAEAPERALFWPMAEINLSHEPRLPISARSQGVWGQGGSVETITPAFVSLVQALGVAVFADAKSHVPIL